MSLKAVINRINIMPTDAIFGKVVGAIIEFDNTGETDNLREALFHATIKVEILQKGIDAVLLKACTIVREAEMRSIINSN